MGKQPQRSTQWFGWVSAISIVDISAKCFVQVHFLTYDLSSSYAGGTTSMYYFYMWRFGWVFYLISLFFMVVAFFAGFLACCGRLGSALSGLVSLAALFFYSIAASLMTYGLSTFLSPTLALFKFLFSLENP